MAPYGAVTPLDGARTHARRPSLSVAKAGYLLSATTNFLVFLSATRAAHAVFQLALSRYVTVLDFQDPLSLSVIWLALNKPATTCLGSPSRWNCLTIMSDQVTCELAGSLISLPASDPQLEFQTDRLRGLCRSTLSRWLLQQRREFH